MAPYLRYLAKEILSLEPEGFSKVHFAKVIYFVEKGLILDNLSKQSNLGFTRMPLGPVPVGFMEIKSDADFTITTELTGLSYNKELYKANQDSLAPTSNRTNAIQGVLSKIRGLTASQLVEFAHEEPSWINNPNGKDYFISDEDLKVPLPVKNGHRIDASLEEQKLQSKLMEGMLRDIVIDSTMLEYPDFKPSE